MSGTPPAAPRRGRGVGSRTRRRAALPLLLVTLLGGWGGTASPAAADTIRDQQRWALDAVNASTAWETSRGEGVTVAVLDTGVDDSHQDLAGAVLPGEDFVGYGAEPGDDEWAAHGTAMAGIIAGRGHGPDGGRGVLGVAPEARILPVRVLLEEDDPERGAESSGTGSAVARGIRWAVDEGADVINLSLGDDRESARPDAEEDAAVRYALEHGVPVVASAGNGGENGDPVSYPAGYPGVIAVTAVDRSGSRASFSTQRWYATLNAPGKDVIFPAPGDRYMEGWGTSAAAAFVSGTIALVRSHHPDLSPAEIKRLLAATAQDRPAGGHSEGLGNGTVDAATALDAAADGTVTGNDADRPSPAAAEPFTAEHFGAGPRPPEDPGAGASWVVPAAAGGGVLLLTTGAVLLYRPRTGTGPGPARRPY